MSLIWLNHFFFVGLQLSQDYLEFPVIVYLLACIDSTDVPARSLSGITHAHALALGHTVALLLGERWACGVRINMHLPLLGDTAARLAHRL